MNKEAWMHTPDVEDEYHSPDKKREEMCALS
jgi:hypothetical protein